MSSLPNGGKDEKSVLEIRVASRATFMIFPEEMVKPQPPVEICIPTNNLGHVRAINLSKRNEPPETADFGNLKPARLPIPPRAPDNSWLRAKDYRVTPSPQTESHLFGLNMPAAPASGL